jgi:hypothetical protein
MWSVTLHHHQEHDYKSAESFSQTLGCFDDEAEAYRFAIRHAVYMNVTTYKVTEEASPYIHMYDEAADATLEHLRELHELMEECLSDWMDPEGEEHQTSGYSVIVELCPVNPKIVEREGLIRHDKTDDDEFTHYLGELHENNN